MWLQILRLWLGPLPVEEIFPEKKPNLFLHWFIHPVKRRLAKYYLIYLQKFCGLKVIALTGSAGKTTTKNILQAILPNSFATADNTTSTFNIPTAILKTSPSTKYLILEMGVEYLGDMDFYTWLAHPDVAILLNIGPTHLKYLKSIENVAREKSKIFTKLPSSGAAIIPTSFTPPINCKSYTFGGQVNSFCQIISSRLIKNLTTEIKLIINQQPVTYRLPLIGEHLAENLAAAVTTAYTLGIQPASITVSPPPHRLNPITLKSGAILIDDTYNANPLAVSASLTTLIKLSKLTRKTPVFVFAQMNELGSHEKSAHLEIGELIKNYKLKIKNFGLFCLGPATKFTIKSAGFGQYFESLEKLYQAVKPLALSTSYLVLVKGSRSWHLENLVIRLVSSE